MAELSSMSYNSYAFVRMSWIMTSIYSKMQAKFGELRKLSKLSSVS